MTTDPSPPQKTDLEKAASTLYGGEVGFNPQRAKRARHRCGVVEAGSQADGRPCRGTTDSENLTLAPSGNWLDAALMNGHCSSLVERIGEGHSDPCMENKSLRDMDRIRNTAFMLGLLGWSPADVPVEVCRWLPAAGETQISGIRVGMRFLVSRELTKEGTACRNGVS
ncbi:hypothetical protein IMZ48_44790 [Candidatus Bathyarchaeota archaeon]|nr:hypothetical protein [Candidatus Bathyarchaeota archaeon]